MTSSPPLVGEDPWGGDKTQGLQALKAGDGAKALHHFERIILAGFPDTETWLGCAFAHLIRQDLQAALRCADEALALEPQNLRGLLLKADVFEVLGDAQAAASFYSAAVRSVASQEHLPDSLAREYRRASGRVEAYQARLTAAIEGVAAKAKAVESEGLERFLSSTDLLLGRQRDYPQRPRQYFFPGLPAVPFYPRQMFPWLEALEACSEGIRNEAIQLLARDQDFVPYIQQDTARPVLNRTGLYNNSDWGACFLFKNGVPQVDNQRRCPQTMAALAHVPLVEVPGRSPTVLFSRLRPGTRIPAHHGFFNTRLIGHLGLVVPDGCGFRVGGETRKWEEGRGWIFDDTIEHEAWNDHADQARVVLIFEVWQPALQAVERRWVRELFQALDADGLGGAAGSI